MPEQRSSLINKSASAVRSLLLNLQAAEDQSPTSASKSLVQTIQIPRPMAEHAKSVHRRTNLML